MTNKKDKEQLENEVFIKEEEKLTLERMTKQTEENTTIFTGEEETVSDKVSMLAISELLDMSKLKTISRIKVEQTPILTKLYLFSDVFDTPFTKDLADYILQLQISVNGLGRKELVSLVQQRDMSIELQAQQSKVSSKNIFK